MKKLFLITFILGIFAIPSFVLHAQTRSYYYDSIDTDIVVNEDTTIDIAETQVYNFTGEYHQGFRTIPLTKIDSITDIQVIDGATLKPLEYTRSKLTKTDPSSWGKYTYYTENGNQNIEWYYNAKDEPKIWILNYKVHGALGFFEDHDELYWNLFTEYDVAIKNVSATVKLFKPVSDPSLLRVDFYTDSGTNQISRVSPDQSFNFSVKNIPPRGKVTIAASWPKGIILVETYRKDFLKTHPFFILDILGILLVIGSIFWRPLYTYFKETLPQKREGTIIAEYEPPQKLKPAMAEVIVKEKVTDKTWPATIVDLAVRSHIKIVEEEFSQWEKIGQQIPRVIFSIIMLVIVAGFLAPLFLGQIGNDFFRFAIPAAFIGFVVFLRFFRKHLFQPAKSYRIDRVAESSEAGLEDYERSFLRNLFAFGSGNYFSMREMKKASPVIQREMYESMQALKKELYTETETDTKAYEVTLTKSKGWQIFAGVLLIGGFLFSNLFWSSPVGGLFIFIFCLVFSVFLILWGLNDARLNKQGRILKKDWLGFKLYLETAEKYRMQNLTPDLFEKYLPYAIIFGVEKKWSKAFDGLNIAPPNWYRGSAVYAGGVAGMGAHTAGVSSFSPSGFSTSFSTAFSSAFASSGASGSAGGGGGGGAGGGGGGGGGGAS